jgi:RNA polymerase sigma-70 factor (ECF subfamily)
MIGEMALAGPESAVSMRDFGLWVEGERRRIYMLCRRLLQDDEEADSAAQDAFLKAYEAWSGGRGAVDDPGKWVTRIAVNTCLDRLRSRKWKFWRNRPDSETESLILGATAQQGPDAEALVYARQIAARLSAALDRLSPRQRAVWTLRHYEDLPLEQIAELLGLDVGTVKAHMSRAVQKLRAELRDLYAGGRGE